MLITNPLTAPNKENLETRLLCSYYRLLTLTSLVSIQGDDVSQKTILVT